MRWVSGRLLFALIVMIWVMIGAARVARAAAVEARPLTGVLSLGVTDEGGGHRRSRSLESFLTRELATYLRRTGQDVRKASGATARACRGQECLDGLASQHRAGTILGATVRSTGSRDYYVKAWLYRSAASGLPRRQVREQEDLCAGCAREALAAMVSELVGRLLRRGDEEEAPVVAAAPAVLAATPTLEPPRAVAAPSRCGRGSSCRKALLLSFATVAVAAAVSTITVSALNDQPAAGPCAGSSGHVYASGCLWDFGKSGVMPGAIAGLGITGGLALIGLTATLALP